MLSRFFVDRPIFAAVLSLAVTLAGGLAYFSLPLSLYPPISPPIVQVDATYPGANARVVSETVAAPIEQQVNGVEGMMYMASQCGNDGSYNLMVTFKNGMDLNMAQVLVQNRVNLALPQLPDVLKRTGITTRKRSPDILLSTGFFSTDGRYDQLYLSNFALMQVREELARLPGVADVTMVGQRDYSIRVWVNPANLAARGLTATDVVNAIREQNAEVATGQLGQEPARGNQPFQVTLNVQGRLSTPEEFGKVILKHGADHRVLRLRDIARIELGPKNEDLVCHVDGKPASSLTVWQLPGANALATAETVKAKLEDLKKSFPPGVDYVIRYDTTPFIRESMNEVFKTLRDAILLVAVVVLVFLRNWRSALIPLVAVPMAIIGTFAVMAIMGFSLNNLTLFGLVLAIGIVVDDAIVVVEAVEHHIELGLTPRAATLRAMEQVSGPVVAVGLVLSAVFVPCAFIGGVTGLFFRQFALTIAVSTLLSAFNSLTLSPALAALLLRPLPKETDGNGKHRLTKPEALPRWGIAILGGWLAWRLFAPEFAGLIQRYAMLRFALLVSWSPYLLVSIGASVGWLVGPSVNQLLGWLFGLFNDGFRALTGWYARAVGMLLRVSVLVLAVYGGLLALTYWGLRSRPTGFIPAQDMGYLLINAQLPDAASAQRTQDVMARAEKLVLQTPGIKHALMVSGQSFLLSAYDSNFGSMFVILDDFDKRQDPKLYADAIAESLRKRLNAEIIDADFSTFGPSPVRGVGRAGGFKFMVEDRGDLGLAELQKQTDRLAEEAHKNKQLGGLTTVFRANVPQLYMDVDRQETMQRHVHLSAVTDTLEVYLGSLYVNDFNRFGRTWQVIVQSEAPYRQRASSVNQLRVRNAKGGMVPLGSVGRVRDVNGPIIVTRYNMYPAAFITGKAAPGVSSGQAITVMEDLAHRWLPPSMAFEWTELAFLELLAGHTAMIIFGFSVAMVFLVLAALYESWSLPLAVILVVPLCLLSSVTGVAMANMDINVLTQVGFIVLVGLASKNAILIVEFAKLQRDAGASRREATLAACTLRLRPIIMTSFAFILGVVPLMLSHGAGAEMRQTLGIAVFSGMLGVTLVGIFLTPVFFYVINRVSETRLFSSRAVRMVGGLTLDVLSVGVHRVGRALGGHQRRSAPISIAPKADGTPTSTNGEARRDPAEVSDPLATP